LRRLLKKYLGCVIQHDGWPCNTCFHDFAIEDLGMDEDIAHLFWIIVLAIRGDYLNDISVEDFLGPNRDFFKKLYERAKK